jgi:hypothetical protein
MFQEEVAGKWGVDSTYKSCSGVIQRFNDY